MGNKPEAAAGFLAHRGLIALATGAAMAEAALLAAFAPAARVLAPQVTTLPPLAVFHDLRWLYSAQRSWLEFILVLAGLILARSAVNSLLVRLAWPAAVEPPTLLEALRCALGFTVFAFLLMSPVVSLTLGVAILPFSWPFLATLPVMLLIAVPLSHGGATSCWWRMLPPPAAVGWLLTDFAVLSVTAAVIGRLPFFGAVPAAGLAGLVNARAWYGLTGAVARARARAGGWPGGVRLVPAVPVAMLAAIAVITLLTKLVFVVGIPTGNPPAAAAVQVGQAGQVPVVMGARTANQAGPPASPGRAQPAARLDRRQHPPVLEVAGFGSWCCEHGRSLADVMPGTLVQQFSYRGLDPAGHPLPYGPAASDLPLPVLGDRIAAQVWRLHARTGQPVDIVAESEGTLGVYAMLARHPDVPLAAVVLLSPIVAPGQVSYPVGDGSAPVPGDELQGVVWFVGGLSPFGTSGARTLIESVNQVGAQFAEQAARDHHLPWLELVPLADAVTLPACSLPSNVLMVPALHGALLDDPESLRMVRDFLTDHRVSGPSGLRTTAEIVAAAASAWRIPQATTPSPPCRR
ncbi:MAG TPA: hypothetical protein VGJ54_18205 [Streptosporangiaceae bacterium]|jgi:hypothetical protein